MMKWDELVTIKKYDMEYTECHTPIGQARIEITKDRNGIIYKAYLDDELISTGDDIAECKHLCKCFLEIKFEELKEFLYGME